VIFSPQQAIKKSPITNAKAPQKQRQLQSLKMQI
jgi:hypothetical protein